LRSPQFYNIILMEEKNMYKIVLIPLIVVSLGQILKAIIKIRKGQSFHRGILISYGGMPSTHTAFSLSVLILVFVYEGLSASFAIAVVFSILMIRDALGIRIYMEEHSKAINKLLKNLPPNYTEGLKTQEEHIGHTIPEILGGAIFSIALTVLLYLILPEKNIVIKDLLGLF